MLITQTERYNYNLITFDLKVSNNKNIRNGLGIYFPTEMFIDGVHMETVDI